MKTRCAWSMRHNAMMQYHDEEWGVPLHDDQKLFEFLILEGAQAGLNWQTILLRREGYREVFDNFAAEKIARYTSEKLEQLLQDTKIIRNRLKISSAVKNAQAFLEVKNEFGNFNCYIWQFVNGKPKQNHWKNLQEVPTHTKESDAMAKDLKKRGFTFVGTTICYAFMQAIGMVNDHTTDCFKYSLLKTPKVLT